MSRFSGVASPILAWRKFVAFRRVAKTTRDLGTAPELVRRIHTAATHVDQPVAAMWTIERLGSVLATILPPEQSTVVRQLRPEVRPIVHVGAGVGLVESTGFEPAHICERIARFSNRSEELFAYESIGAMLGIYESRLPRWWVGLRPLCRPNPHTFLGSFGKFQQRVIAHGYGRLIYFNSLSLRAAVLAVRKRDFLDTEAAVAGLGFAHVMVNHRDLPSVLDTTITGRLQPALSVGMTYALVFLGWLFPECLAHYSHPRVSAARHQLEVARRQGRLPAFLE